MWASARTASDDEAARPRRGLKMRRRRGRRRRVMGYYI